jgi:hypothetical protein
MVRTRNREAPFAKKENPDFRGFLSGPARIRTWDQRIMSPLL